MLVKVGKLPNKYSNPESNAHKQDPRQLLGSRGSAACNSHTNSM